MSLPTAEGLRTPMSPPQQPESPFLRALRRALVEDVRAEIERGHTHGQIAARLGASTAAVHVAAERLRRVRLLDRGDEL
jgi:hypothetical protein